MSLLALLVMLHTHTPHHHAHTPRSESARRMRAKRGEAVKELEGSVSRLKDRNKALSKRNQEYARALAALQAEVSSLKGQLVLQPAAAAGAAAPQRSGSGVQVCV
jgi:predicted RNase H-like nuclease (RuvC/YqgF family)